MAINDTKVGETLADALDAHIAKAGLRQRVARGSAPEKRPRTWKEIEAYAEWIASIRVREELLALKREVV